MMGPTPNVTLESYSPTEKKINIIVSKLPFTVIDDGIVLLENNQLLNNAKIYSSVVVGEGAD
ncbi:hypothetical protein [Alteromonas stellipolaris]